TSAILGLQWYRYRRKKVKNYAVEFLVFGFVNHIAMLLCQLTISFEQVMKVILPVLAIYPLTTMIAAVALSNSMRRVRAIEEVHRSEALMKASFEGAKGILVLSLDKEYRYLFFNEAHEQSIENTYHIKIKKNMSFLDALTIEEDRLKAKKGIDRALNGESFSSIEHYQTQTEPTIYETFMGPIRDDKNQIIGITSFSIDITKRVMSEKKLEESEYKNRILIKSMKQGLALHEMIFDEDQNPIDYRFLEVNESFERITGLKRKDIIGKTVREVLPNTEDEWIQAYGEVVKTKIPKDFEQYSIELQKTFFVSAFSPEKNQFAVIVNDITERIKQQEEIIYLSYHDYLTGLTNRRYYEETLEKAKGAGFWPLSVVMADINGLKLVNDAFGHLAGDEMIIQVTNLLKKSFPKKVILSRIGGDEFVAILPKTSREEAKEYIQRFRLASKSIVIKGIELSVSFGTGYQEKAIDDVNILVNEAEKEMYNNKVYEIASNRSNTIMTIINTLYLKSPREERHSSRVSELCQKIGRHYQLRDDEIKILKVMGNLHDIGKIAIDTRILDKPGTLNEEEWDEVKRHPEIGYRILSTANEYAEMAEDILAHHERYDGTGYPKGLKGTEIPWRARVIAIADSFDAMTTKRTYRETFSYEEAIQEIRKNKGIQFDPEIADCFIQIIQEELLS
ncbi:MAG: diguanylate cyclase, partial [Bacilli bacterium]|nr:diguanylate cyclase [Bacilli bacterium]